MAAEAAVAAAAAAAAMAAGADAAARVRIFMVQDRFYDGGGEGVWRGPSFRNGNYGVGGRRRPPPSPFSIFRKNRKTVLQKFPICFKNYKSICSSQKRDTN